MSSETFNANIVKTTIPQDVQPIQPSSASKFIISRRFKRFLPDQQTTFSYAGSDKIRFTLNDNTAFWRPKSHYMKFKVTVTGSDAAKYLDVGGASALFQRISVRTASGARIEERDAYNLYSSLKSHVMDSPECVEFDRHQQGDSMGSLYQSKPYSGYDSGINGTQLPEVVAATGLGAFEITADGAVTVTAGDLVYVAGREFKVTVSSATAAFAVTPSPLEVFLTNADAAGLPIYVVQSAVEPRRKQVANQGSAVELTYKLDLGLLMGDWYLPLPMMRNLQIELDLARPEFALVSPAAASDIGYTISDPELICELVEMDRTIVDQYKELFNGSGISFPFETYRYNNRSLTGSSNEVQVYANVRSAQSVINCLTDGTFIVADAAARSAESVSTFKKYQMSELEVLSGSEKYPFYGPVRVIDNYGTDAYKNARKAMAMDSKMSNSLSCGRIHPSDLVSTTSGKFIFGAVLGREDGDSYAGLDLVNENVQIKMTFGDGSQKYLHSFLKHSATLSVSSQGIIVRS